jgi:hypothetical protein
MNFDEMNSPTLYLIVGLPCAGKTTYARQLEREQSALRLTPDEWHTQLFGLDFDLDRIDDAHNDRHNVVESLMWDVAARVLSLGVNVILDFGFWSKSEREDYRNRAAKIGAASEVHFLDVSEEDLLTRLAKRNASLPPNTFAIPERKLKEWMSLFQPPQADELRRREATTR